MFVQCFCLYMGGVGRVNFHVSYGTWFEYTVEPPNKGHVGTKSFVLYREVSFIWRLKYTGIIGIGISRFVLYREVFFIQSVLYRRFHCIHYFICLSICIIF